MLPTDLATQRHWAVYSTCHVHGLDSMLGSWRVPLNAELMLENIPSTNSIPLPDLTRVTTLSSSYDDIEPTDMGWTHTGDVSVSWSDGRDSTYTPALLRSICPCAGCQGTHGGPPKAFQILTANQVQGAARQIEITSVEPVGHYAVCFHWGDGHSDGIYTWSYLRRNCPAEHAPPENQGAS